MRELPSRRRLSGTFRVPGDKSISHRALMFSAIAQGQSRLRGVSQGADVRSTRRVLEAAGIVFRDEGEAIVVDGRGWQGLDQASDQALVECDCGNSGTSARLLMGLFAARCGRFRLHGDASLSRRPMKRVTGLLSQMGARFEGGDCLPLIVQGSALSSVTLSTAVASAQVKSALILAALQAAGTSVIEEPAASRDHTERMLVAMGAPLQSTGLRTVRVEGGGAALLPLHLDVPGDPSSAAFAIALACLLPGSHVTVENIALSPRRIGFYRLLSRMGAKLELEQRVDSPEPTGSITARGSLLHGIDVAAADVVDAIDELPLLATVAAAASGPSTIRGASELRHKESDRIATTAAMLRAFGASIDELPDGFAIAGGTRFVAAAVDAHGDHRIAMSAAVAAALAPGPSSLTGGEWVAISYPGFFDDLERLSLQP